MSYSANFASTLLMLFQELAFIKLGTTLNGFNRQESGLSLATELFVGTNLNAVKLRGVDNCLEQCVLFEDDFSDDSISVESVGMTSLEIVDKKSSRLTRMG